MPIHDWTRVNAGVFHDFHGSWITEIKRVLNNGILPEDYYALSEQTSGETVPDVLTLKLNTEPGNGPQGASTGTSTLAVAPPQVALTAFGEAETYVRRKRRLVIRHNSGDQIVALVEIVSRGNKASQRNWNAFLDKAVAALERGYQLLIVDLYPPGPRDPEGLHGAMWEVFGEEPYTAPSDKPLTLAAYITSTPLTAFVQPAAVGDSLPTMPLFLSPYEYVSVPLESTYQASFESIPRHLRKILEA